MINWQPFEGAPKDGRWILIWAESCDVRGDVHHEPHLTYWIENPVPKNSRWYNRDGGYNATAWAEINPPGGE